MILLQTNVFRITFITAVLLRHIYNTFVSEYHCFFSGPNAKLILKKYEEITQRRTVSIALLLGPNVQTVSISRKVFELIENVAVNRIKINANK